MSLPVWGAWIEIRTKDSSISPRVRSLPVWGAWIEISSALRCALTIGSLPVWGAWIEIIVQLYFASEL